MIVRTFVAQIVAALYLCFSFTSSCADLASAIVECNATFTSDEGTNYDLIADSCPGLIGEIELSRWGETLAPGWREELSYWEISQFEYFVSYYGHEDSGSSEISLSTLDRIVAGLSNDVQKPDNESIWDRFITWLSNLLSDETDYSLGWLSEWLSNIRVSTSAIEIIFWLLTAVTIVAAIVVIVTEIKAARELMPANVGKSKKSEHVDGILVDDRSLTLKDVDKADLHEKPSVLLQLFLQRFEYLGIAPYRSACTHREARNIVSDLGNNGAEVFSRVSESAERIRFSGTENRPRDITRVVSAGMTLFNNLELGQS